jgi:uncharacterized protein
MKAFRILGLCGIATLVAVPVMAQTVGIGSTKGGATAQVTAAISKVVSSKAGFQMRTQPMGGTQQYIPVVNAGELEFGVSNMLQAYMARSGTGLSAGRKYDNLRLVATLMTFRTGLLVARNSGIDKVADLKGKRVPNGFKAAPLFQVLMTGYMRNGGLGWDDVKKVPAVALRQHWNAFKQGKVDVVIAAVGSAPVKDMNANISGGVRYLSFDTAGADADAVLKMLPRTYYFTVKPAKPLVGIAGSTTIMAFDYMLWTNKGVKDDTVYRVAKAIYESEKELKGMSPLWRSHFSKRMGKNQDFPYHPGAVRFYKEQGIWKR